MKKNFKKLLLFALVLFCSVSIINAEVATVGNNSYVSGKKIYCGEKEVLFSSVIDKSNKVIVADVDDVSKLYIWNEDNTCTDLTTQDYLDYSNSKSVYSSTSGNVLETYNKNFLYVEAYILNTTDYNKSEKYYKYDVENQYMVEAEVDESTTNLNNYFVLRYYKNPDTTTVDSNTKYYKINENYQTPSIMLLVDNSEVTEEKMNYFYVETTLEEAKSETKTYTYDEDTFNKIKENVYQASLEVWDEKMYLVTYQYDMETLEISETTYYDENGKEITEYKNSYLSFTENYKLVYSYTNKTLKVYEKNTNQFITEISFESGNTPFAISNIEWNKGLYFMEIGDSYITNYVKKYEVLAGDNQTFDDNDLTITFNGNYKLFESLLVNDTKLDSKNYTVKEGSTVITLSKDYLSTLENGEYTITATFSDGGKASATIKIGNELIKIISIIAISVVCIALTVVFFLNKKKK